MPIPPRGSVSEFGRRSLLQGAGAMVAWPLLTSVAGLLPKQAMAAGQRVPFDAVHWQQVLAQLGAQHTQVGASILIDAPDIAENGAYVPISITSGLPLTSRIAIIVENNPTPLVTTLRLSPGVEGFISTQIKMNESSRIHAVVEANGHIYTATRAVQVINGGCG